MSLILQKFQDAKAEFDKEHQKDESNLIMQKIIKLINELGVNFNTLDGGSLAEIQMKLAGYKFFLSDAVSSMQQNSEALKVELKELKAKRWDEVRETIKAEKGKVNNAQEIENVITLESRAILNEQILYEGMYFKYKMKMSALDDVLTAIVQKISALKREIELANL